MIGCGYLPHLDSYHLLLSGLCDDGDFGRAKSMFCDLIGMDYNCDEITWRILIDGLLKKGHVYMCYEMLSIMEERHCLPSP